MSISSELLKVRTLPTNVIKNSLFSQCAERITLHEKVKAIARSKGQKWVSQVGEDMKAFLLAAAGADPPMTPSEVQVLSVASTSAVVGWVPADSALEHRVVVDDVARVVIRPGGYRCTITGNFT